MKDKKQQKDRQKKHVAKTGKKAKQKTLHIRHC